MSLINKKRVVNRILASALSVAMTATMIPTGGLSTLAADDEPYVISLDRPVYSSADVGDNTADKIVDGDYSTRWESPASDNQWVYVDLGKEADITGFHIKWEAAYAKSYKVQVSNDEESWTDIYKVGNASGDGENESQEAQAISISYTNNGNGSIFASWTGIDNANYKVYVNDEGTYATAPDKYVFSNHPVNNGTIALEDGTYTLIVVAVDKNTGAELGRGTKKVVMSKQEATTEAQGSGQEPADPKEVNVNVVQKARYVRIYMTERATNYGYSIYEFEVLGTNGVVSRPDAYGTNLALNKTTSSSSLRDVWWMYQDGVLNQTNVLDKNAVDGNKSTSWTSGEQDNQWISVDLQQPYSIGRVIINWTSDAGKIYDIQVSDDNTRWTTLYRKTNGYPELVDNVILAGQRARYIRIYGYARVENGSGFGIDEIEVYEYKDGDETKTYQIGELSDMEIVNTNKGSYITKAIYEEKAKLPVFIDEENVKVPIDSNDWWQSAMIKTFGNPMSTMPYKAAYSKKGLSLLTTTQGWLPTMGETDVNVSVNTETQTDLYILPENLDTATAYDRVHDYGDYSVELQLCDKTGVAMTSTHVKGSPYTFIDFGTKENVYISVPNLTAYFGDDGNAILTDGAKITTDHIGIHVTDSDNKDNTKTSNSYYAINLPEGTTVKNAGGKLKITYNGSDRYMSVGTMPDKASLNTFYQHGYAFVTDTEVGYTYSENLSKITSEYTVTTTLKRPGFSDTTMQLMLPHQWKKAVSDNTAATYPSIRGEMHGVWANRFETVDVFEGLLPTFAKPDNDEFDNDKVIEYLQTLDSATANLTPAADAYWEGKNLHPLGIGALMADQLGETEMRDKFLTRLKTILVNWFTYTGEGDVSYFIYDENWGTLYYLNSEFGANTGICDHHFTYGYFMFGAAVLATYDKEFYNDYKDMIEMLIRDYANPSDNDDEYCRFRAYDLYESHSWAGGYADNDSGNNQESASESLFSWVGMYLWGILTENDTYRDAAIFGFSNEMEAVKQYWFDYDEDNWIDEWPYEVVGQVYGGINFYGTFFGGQPLYVYGIQWLPISEYLTYYGMNQERAAKIYAALESDTQIAREKAKLAALKGGKSEEEALKEYNDYTTPDTGWQHITWPFLSQTNPTLALEKFNAHTDDVQKTDTANTYWFINSMIEYGYKTEDVYATGDLAAAVYYNKNTGKYTANVWNPCDTSKTVTFKRTADNAELGSATVGAKAFVKFEIDENQKFDYTQASTPSFKTTGLSDGAVEQNVSGIRKYDDTQIVEIESSTDGATIYYTTDGTIPTIKSKVYTGKILVSSSTTVKAIAVKNGYIDSTYASLTLEINGDNVQGTDNLALGREVTASTQGNENSAAKMTDGNKSSRWESEFNDDEWVYVDLGAEHIINTVKIFWEAAYAKEYEIQTSLDGNDWNTVARVTNSSEGEKDTEFAATNARYVKMKGISRATAYGYSIYEFEVYGAVQAQAPVISVPDGTYDTPQTVTLTTSVKGAEIKYTLDGTDPTEDSPSYTQPFTISNSTVVKAATYRKGMTLSDVVKSSIIIRGTVGLSASELTVAVGNTKTITALTDGNVTWSSENDQIASVTNGEIRGVSKGTVNITATVGTNKAVCRVTVVDAVKLQSITLSETELSMIVNTQASLAVGFVPANTTDDTSMLTWESDNPKVASVEGGKITAKTEGMAIITVRCLDCVAKCTVTVNPKYSIAEKLVSDEYNLALSSKLFQSGRFEGSLDNLVDKIGFNGQAGGNWASQTVEDGAKDAFLIFDLDKSYTLNQIDAMYIEWKNNMQTLPTDGFKIMVADDAGYDTVVEEDGVTVSEDKSNWTVVFDSDVNQAKNSQSGYDWVEDEVGCLSVLPFANDTYKKTFNHVKIAFDYNGDRKPWGIQAYEIAILKNDEDMDTDASGGENPTEKPEETKPSEITTDKDGIPVSSKLKLDGYQFSVKTGGTRTLYSVDAEVDGKAVVERGLVYGLKDNISSKDMVATSNSAYVKAFVATSAGKRSEKINPDIAETYVMTMKQNIGKISVRGLTAGYYVRAYAKLSDGTYVYSELGEYSIYGIADYLYKNNEMGTREGHQYLYDNILSVVNKDYPAVGFDSSNTMTRAE